MASGTGLGIDIGAETVKVVRVRLREREVQVLGAASYRRDSLDADASDPDAVARAAAARAAELGVRGRPALAGLSGQQVILRTLRASREEAERILGREVRQASGADLSEFACDFRRLDLPEQPAEQCIFIAAAARRDLLEARSAAFATGGLRLDGFCPSSLALFNVLQRSLEAEPRGTAVLLDIGAEKTHVVLARDGAFAFARSVMHGGSKFTQAVAGVLGVDATRAEEIKCRRGAVLTPREIRDDGTEDARFYKAILEVADELSGAVQSTLSYARAQTGVADLEPERYYLAGGGARLDGLREHLQAALGRPVRWLDLGGWLAGGQQVAEPPSPYGVALGLALAAADPKAFALRLMPQWQRRRGQFWGKGVYAVAAAAMVLLAIVAHLLGTLREERNLREELATLTKLVQSAAAAEKRMAGQRREIEDLQRKIALLGDPPRANALLLRTLDELRRAAPEAITLGSLRFASEPGLPPGQRPARVSFTVRGAAERRGTADAGAELEAFVARLRGEPLRAGRLKQRRTGTPTPGRVDFEITFSPSDALVNAH